MILDRINNSIRAKTQINQWTSTTSVLEWFSKLRDKRKLTFLQFDIVDFYPSINENLLTKSLTWAKQYANISDTDVKTIMHSRRSLLYDNNGNPWEKRDTQRQFDVTMGAFDGAELCELVGLFILHNLKLSLNIASIGLYRDDGLAVMESCSGSTADRIRKQIIKIFQDYDLKITVQTNLKVVDFLDATLDLNTGTHQPYRKPNDEPTYINCLSNHPPSILRNIPPSIDRRISNLSSNEEIFEKSTHIYQEALKSAGHNHKMKYNAPTSQPPRKRNRKRQTIWYNPPFSRNVKTNIGSRFLKLVDKHFPRGHKLNKIFNRNSLKISYSCMNNMQSIINAHNVRTIKNARTSNAKTCNCRKRESCPLSGECLATDIVYKATVVSNIGKASYIGLASGPFKTRYNNHTKSFRNDRYQKETELSKHIWSLKKKKLNYTINWKILRRSNTKKRKSGICNLCIDEKFEILNLKENRLNKRTELISTCRHYYKRKPMSRVKKK